MASTARRIGLSTRSARKTSREEDGVTSKLRKISFGKKISREENTNSKLGAKQLSHGIEDAELYCSLDRFQKMELLPNASRSRQYVSFDKGSVTREIGNQPKRKVSVYARPELLERKVSQQRFQRRWQTFLIQYEPFILSTLALLIVFVSIYIFFVERQSLFSKQGI